MAVNQLLAGVSYRAAPYRVGAEKLAEFARATLNGAAECQDQAAAQALGYADVVAVPTFAAIVAQRAEALYYHDPASGVDFSRVVHASESITHHRPIIAGDTLEAEMCLESVAARAGIEFVTTRCEITADGAPVATVVSTLAIRGEGR